MRSKANVYNSKEKEISGSSLGEVMKHARYEYHVIQKYNPRRLSYVRSPYFGRDKIFISTFWTHLGQKGPRDKFRRTRLFSCAIDLIKFTRHRPDITEHASLPGALLYRFYGLSTGGNLFVVQIKENKKSGRKDFISVFPIK
ncbi:MAG: hypothetical protein ACR2FM_05705 [Candidatus Saccharimonadales bacterium]